MRQKRREIQRATGRQENGKRGSVRGSRPTESEEKEKKSVLLGAAGMSCGHRDAMKRMSDS